jgi:hypothetical protein
MKFLLIIVFTTFCFLACTGSKKISGLQGISGQVFWLEGNLMPAIGDTSYHQRAAGIPIQRTVFIHEATNSTQTEISINSSLYAKVNSRLILKTRTDKNGYFKVNLEPGKYSVFIQEDKGLFANIFDGQGIINPVTVETGKFTDIVIKVNYKAFY